MLIKNEKLLQQMLKTVKSKHFGQNTAKHDILAKSWHLTKITASVTSVFP